jgi:ABC-type multidrug transport system fused ATPase/permease subunit
VLYHQLFVTPQRAADQPDTLSAVLRGGIRLVGRFVRWHPVAFWLAVGGAALFAAAIVASAVVIGNIADTLIIPVLDEGEAIGGRVWPAMAAVVAVAIWKALGITLRRVAASYLQFRTQADVRQRLIEHQMGLELAWYSRQTTGDLLAVSETDARMSTFVLAPLPYGTGASLLLVGSAAMIAWIDPLLGLIALVALAAIVVIDARGSWSMFVAFQEVQRRRGVVSSVAHESFDGALTVKALGREDYETSRMRLASEDLRDGLIEVGRLWGNYRAVVESLPVVTTLVLIVAGIARIDAGAITAGDVVTIAYLLSLLTVPVRLVGFVLWEMAASQAAWRRVDAILTVEDFVSHGNLAARREATGAAVDGDRVDFAYEAAEPILHDLQLDIPASRIVAVVGPTASGKSTLAMLLARLWDPQSGQIRLDGRDLKDFARSELPGEIAYVAQEAFLFDDTVAGNIRLGLPLSADEIEHAARVAGADGFIRELDDGYETRIGERGVSLSGGQRQRIALARAVARRPRLLIMDDATSAVDPSVESRILEALRDAELPSTVIVVAYRRSSITLADDVVYIDGGRVVAHGTHRDLMLDVPGYARLLRAYEEDAAQRRGGPAPAPPREVES